MPMARGYTRGFGRRRGARSLNVINSIKNVPSTITPGVASANTFVLIAKAVNTPVSTVATDVSQGCQIRAIWIEMWMQASAIQAEGISVFMDAYIWKNPGANLTAPAPGSVGTSNEKKFVFKQWKGLIGARTQGTPFYFWKGWLKIPRIYQRMGTDDLIQLVFKSEGTASLMCTNFIYKWYR